MAAQKRKAVSKSAADVFKHAKRAATKKVVEEAEPTEEVEEQKQEEAPAMEVEVKEVNEAQQEEETVAARKKELKAMYMEDLKELLSSQGLETGKKEDMVEALAAHEAKARAEVRENAAKIRAVVVKKKDELEAMTLPELKELCGSLGIKGLLAKPARVEELLKQWQEEDGVDKALAQMAHDLREQQLVSTDKLALRKLCDKAGVDAFVKEVMVERIIRKESAAGRFARPTLEMNEPEVPAPAKKGDMVETLLANEAKRKKELEVKKQQEDAVANKMKELRAMSVEELKKLLVSKGHEAVGKKGDMVEALFAVGEHEDAVAARKSELTAMGADELKKSLSSKGLEAGKKSDMVEVLLAHEAKTRVDLRTYSLKVGEVLAKMREELESKTGAELKELCTSKSLKAGLTKEDRIDRLLEEAAKDGEVDKVLAVMSRDARKELLLSMETSALEQLCDETGADPLVKEVLVERLLAHESEVGFATAEDDSQPAAKKARASKK